MASNNNWTGYGNLTFDPELRRTQNGTAVATLRLAVNNKFKKDDVLFLDVTAWDKQAEFAANYLKKGHRVLVAGELRLETWDDKTTGEKRSKISVTAREIDSLTPKPKGEEAQDGGGADAEEAPKARTQGRRRSRDESDEVEVDQDIPF